MNLSKRPSAISRHWPCVAMPIPLDPPHFRASLPLEKPRARSFLSITAPKPDGVWTPGSEIVLHSLACAMAAHSSSI